MPKRQSRLSTDDILIPVRALLPDGTNPDLTADEVFFQFVEGGLPVRAQPDPASWTQGFWVIVAGDTLAGITVGPDSDPPIHLTKGPWAVWVKVVDTGGTTPVAAVDTLWIY